MEGIIVDLVRRDTVMPERSLEGKEDRLTVSDLRSAIYAQKVYERDVFGRYAEVAKFYGFGRPLPNYCVPALVQPVFGHEIF